MKHWQVTLAAVWLSVTVVWLELPVRYALARLYLQTPSSMAQTVGGTPRQHQCRYICAAPCMLYYSLFCMALYCLMSAWVCIVMTPLHVYMNSVLPKQKFKAWLTQTCDCVKAYGFSIFHIKGNSILKTCLGQHVLYIMLGRILMKLVYSCKDAESAACSYIPLIRKTWFSYLQTVS